MSIGVLANPEVRRATNPTYEIPAYEPQYDLGNEVSAGLLDIPGFSFSEPAIDFGSIYAPPGRSEPSPIPSIASIPSPTAPARTALANARLNSEPAESPRASPSSSSSDTLIDNKFRYVEQQLFYQRDRPVIHSELLKAGFSE